MPPRGTRQAGPARAARVGIVNPETWAFLHDLAAWLSARYATSIFVPTEVRAPIFRERLARRGLRRDLDRFMARHDVVFFEWASEWLARATERPKRCAIVARLHRYELHAWADRINWQAVDRIVMVSESRRRAFARRFPEHAPRTTVVPVGIATDRFAVPRSAFTGTIGTLCHLTPRKRVYDLVLAFADLLKAVPTLRLRIGGDVVAAYADYHEALHALVERLGLEDRVLFDGPVVDPPAWYATIDVFVSHSYAEGLQVAPMEAMAAGCYTLCHHWEGADELVPQQCLYVRDEELVEKVQQFCHLSDDERAIQQARLRAHAVARFDAERVHARVAQVIDDCLAGKEAAEMPGPILEEGEA